VKRFFRAAWPFARRYWFDALIVVGLVVGIVAAVVSEHDNKIEGPLWFDVIAVIAIMAPLFARRRFPFGAPLATTLALGLVSFVDGRLVSETFIPVLSGVAAAVLFGMRPVLRQALAGWAVLVALLGIGIHNDPKDGLGVFVWVSIWFTIAWLVGWAFGGKAKQAEDARERAQRAEREREERARLAVSEERARIARELHDVVGHSVSVMTVQASAVRRLLKPEQEREREALLIVEQTGREAMAEMRRMVGVLRRPEEAPALAPQPSLEHLDKLVEHARESGLPVELTIEGDAVQLPAGVDLTAYRLVQEGLTNALKHARAKHAEVLVRYSNGFVQLTVTDDGTGDGGGDSGGHGLVGMRERISVYGGNLEAGPRPEGGFRLSATLPVGGA
jgi:signal transduction histidine kinase